MNPDGGSIVYADAVAIAEHNRAQIEEAFSTNGMVGGMITPTSPNNQNQRPTEALTSEHSFWWGK